MRVKALAAAAGIAALTAVIAVPGISNASRLNTRTEPQVQTDTSTTEPVVETPTTTQPVETTTTTTVGEIVRYEPGHVIVLRDATNNEVTYTLSPSLTIPTGVEVGRRVTLYTTRGDDGSTMVTRVSTSVTPEGDVKRVVERTHTKPSGETFSSLTRPLTTRPAPRSATCCGTGGCSRSPANRSTPSTPLGQRGSTSGRRTFTRVNSLKGRANTSASVR